MMTDAIERLEKAYAQQQRAWDEARLRIEDLELALWTISNKMDADPCDKYCGHFLDVQKIARDALNKEKK
jgi:hypothetical protein